MLSCVKSSSLSWLLQKLVATELLQPCVLEPRSLTVSVADQTVGLRLGLQRQGNERGQHHEEPRSGARHRRPKAGRAVVLAVRGLARAGRGGFRRPVWG